MRTKKLGVGLCVVWIDDNINDAEYIKTAQNLQKTFGFKKIYTSASWFKLGSLLNQCHKDGAQIALILSDNEFDDYACGGSILEDVARGKYNSHFPNVSKIPRILVTNGIEINRYFDVIDKGQLKRITSKNVHDEPAGVTLLKILHDYQHVTPPPEFGTPPPQKARSPSTS